MKPSYWQTQSSTKPLWPDIEWNRPEQKSRAGRLLVIGGNVHGFRAVAEAHDDATRLGIGQVRSLVPDKLKPLLPTAGSDTVFAPSTKAGSLSKEAQDTVRASMAWADHTLLIGDTGRNSETAIVYETLLGYQAPLTVTRDAIDLLKTSAATLLERPHTTLVVSFAQLQKLLQLAYYPKLIRFSMSLMNLVETLHKVSVTYPVSIVTFHQGNLVIAHDGQVVTQEYDSPMRIWRGATAARSACYQIWTPAKPLHAITTSAHLSSRA